MRGPVATASVRPWGVCPLYEPVGYLVHPGRRSVAWAAVATALDWQPPPLTEARRQPTCLRRLPRVPVPAPASTYTNDRRLVTSQPVLAAAVGRFALVVVAYVGCHYGDWL
ncbi:hypothetical protein BHE74_00006204 [Ensete ventricosum]|nr:hypothetical protein GW17_00040376 [Ensete ventricosum]RWW85143.1 hypothetical protein BHE74_00006204 [Ensete ventricosum]